MPTSPTPTRSALPTPKGSTMLTYTAQQLADLNNRPLYDIACEQIDEDRLDASRWQMSEWHPDGAHLWNGTGLNIVATSFTTDHMADIGVYTDAQMEEMQPWISLIQRPLAEIGTALHALMDLYGAETDLMHDAELPGHPLESADPRAMVRPALPLPAPWPSAIEIAAAYIAEVRANGPEFMANVGNAIEDGMESEVRYEVGRWHRRRAGFVEIDWMGDEAAALRADIILDEAADLAIDTFKQELAR